MPKTLYSKIAVFFIMILIIITAITGSALYFFLGNFVTEEKEGTLKEVSEYVNSSLNYYIEFMNNPIIYNSFVRTLDSYSKSIRGIIWITDKDGRIVFLSEKESIPDIIMEKLMDATGNMKLPDKRQYENVMKGEQYVKETGDFYGLFKDTKVSWLTIEKPYIYKGEIQGAIYLNIQAPEINRARTTVLKFYILSISIAILISALLVYIFSLKLTKPLKLINNAAKQIANGEFSKRVNISSQDEIGQLGESFNHMAGALENLEEMRRAFIANVSHELRTPMTSIHGFIEGILDGTIPPEREREYLSIVSDETRRLSRLTNDLLDLARLESGEMKLTFAAFDLNELIRRCIIKMENLIVKKNIQIEANFHEATALVYADKDSIERVLLNLLHNAIKFVPEGGQITIETAKSKGKVLVSVKDNGVGIDSEEIGLIWDRFYKSDKSRGKDKTGTGLGLAIVKNIINEHGQEIQVESELGKGTVFQFTLNSSKEEIENKMDY